MDRAPRPQAPAQRKQVQLDPGLQQRLLDKMREEQAAAIRRRELTNYVVIPLTVVLIVAGALLSFSDNMGVAILANFLATTLLYVLWRVNRKKIRAWLGLS
ncbi:MAG: hypothetical protein KC543_15860 [Myxococcales bacterium]|nr:hypothetical protein [Myxococcales bacterium]